MAVVIECESVVIRNATVEHRFPGGMQGYKDHVPNSTFCSDGQICRVGFMTGADAISYIEHLVAIGFSPPNREGSPEVAFINQDTGFVVPCDWLELGQVDLGGETKTTVVWLRGTSLSQLYAPPGWNPGQFIRTTREVLGRSFQYQETHHRVESHRSLVTGTVLYVGRPKLLRRGIGAGLKKVLWVAGAVLAVPLGILAFLVMSFLEDTFPKIFGEHKLICENRVLAHTHAGPILLIVFRDGEEQPEKAMSRYMEETIVAHKPAGVILDLLHFRGGFGDDFCMVWIPLLDKSTKRPVPFCVLAKKATARRVRFLSEVAKIPGIAEVHFLNDVAEGMEYLHARINGTA